jgi:glycosyltransferase involved in cell wall biosynthesis
MIIIIPPNYQKGFEGFIKACNKNNFSVYTTNPVIKNVKNLPSLSWSLLFFKLDRAFLWFPSIYFLVRVINKSKDKRIHFVGEPTYLANIIIYFSLIIAGEKPVWSCRVAQNIKFWMPFIFWVSIKLLKRNNNLAFPVSKTSKSLAKNHYGIKNLKILPNGFPDEFLEHPNFISNNRFRIIFIGNFLKRKGIEDFFEVSKSFIKNTEFKFTAIGANKKQQMYYQRKHPNVEILCKMERKNLIKYLDESILMIVPSKTIFKNDLNGIKSLVNIPWSEQFGRIIIESYSRGVNVIAYDSGAISEYIYDKNLLVSEGKVDLLEQSINKYLKEKTYLNQQHRRNIHSYSKKFTWTLVFQRFLKIKNGF